MDSRSPGRFGSPEKGDPVAAWRLAYVGRAVRDLGLRLDEVLASASCETLTDGERAALGACARLLGDVSASTLGPRPSWPGVKP